MTPEPDPAPSVEGLAGAPQAPREPRLRELHGDAVLDDYAWMRDTHSPRLREHLTRERAYYDQQTRRLQSLRGRLAAEMTARVPVADEDSVAWPHGAWWYRVRIPEKSENVVLLRSPSPDGPWRVLLDANVVAAATGYADLGIREPSPDGSLLAWSADTTGAEIYELRIRDLDRDEDLPELIGKTYPGVAWYSDSRALLYLVQDDLFRPFQVWRHRIGTPAAEDELVFEEPDHRFELTLEASRSGELAMIEAASRDTSEVWLVALGDPGAQPRCVQPRERGVEYRVDHARAQPEATDGTLFITTDARAAEFTLVRAPACAPGRENWTPVCATEIAPMRDDTRLVRCDVFAEHLVLSIRRAGLPMLIVTDHDGRPVAEVAGPPAGSIRIEHAEEFDSGSVLIAEESLTEPTRWSGLGLATGERELRKRLDVPGYDPAQYVSEQRMAPVGDGTLVPITLARHRDTPLDGTAPCQLYGYGAYEVSIDLDFDRSLPSLLDRGVVYAVAHVRGGGELGRGWWQQGRMHAKPTTFSDYIAVADWLAGDGAGGEPLVDGSRIVTRGASAGGLLQGAVFSARPDRWRAVVAEVPFVDCLTTMLDVTLPLTANEWDEWGDPRTPDDYAVIRSYSPYDNVPSGPRPALLVTGAVNDPRVGIHEPAKWVAKLRATDAAGSPLLFRARLGAGSHGGSSGRRARIEDEAEVQAFMLDAMGISD